MSCLLWVLAEFFCRRCHPPTTFGGGWVSLGFHNDDERSGKCHVIQVRLAILQNPVTELGISEPVLRFRDTRRGILVTRKK